LLLCRCGTLTPEPEHLSQLEYKHAVFAAKEAAFQAKNSSSGSAIHQYIIPTYVHIVVSDDGTGMGDVAKDVVEKQVKALNEAYATNSQAAGIQWVFKVQSVVKTSGPDMCDQQNEASMKAKLRKGSRDALNLYITDLSACGLLGYSSWPWDLKKKGLNMDGVVIHYDTLPGGQYRPYNLGRTGIHEIGHWLGEQRQPRPHAACASVAGRGGSGGCMCGVQQRRRCALDISNLYSAAAMVAARQDPVSCTPMLSSPPATLLLCPAGLYHTFQNGCNGNGDAVQDTPFCASPSEGCPVHRDTCPQPGEDPVRK
jgi:hypothetical protein